MIPVCQGYLLHCLHLLSTVQPGNFSLVPRRHECKFEDQRRPSQGTNTGNVLYLVSSNFSYIISNNCTSFFSSWQFYQIIRCETCKPGFKSSGELTSRKLSRSFLSCLDFLIHKKVEIKEKAPRVEVAVMIAIFEISSRSGLQGFTRCVTNCWVKG